MSYNWAEEMPGKKVKVMLCQMCKKNEATIKIVKVVGLGKTELSVCSACANYLLGNTISSISFTQNNINEILGNLLNAFYKYSEEDNLNSSKVDMKCPNCGLTYSEFVKDGKLGCSQCYEIFKKQIKPLLERLHGYSEHSGKIPYAIRLRNNRIQQIKKIKDELKEAVSKEEYEKAAQLRDQIIEEEKKVGIKGNE
jgi:protein arginine kinase activator